MANKKRYYYIFVIGILLILIIGYMCFINLPFLGDNSQEADKPFDRTLLVSDNLLLYCDFSNGGVLCSYDIRTKENHIVQDFAGELMKAGDEVFYITKNGVHQIVGQKSIYICDIPDDITRIGDWKTEDLYWIEYTNDIYRIVCTNPMADHSNSRILYETSEFIRACILVNEKLYVFPESGIYCIEVMSGKLDKISNLCGLQCMSDGEHVVFRGYGEDENCPYYEITQDRTITKLTADGGSAANIFQDRLYYEVGGKIKIYNLTNKTLENTIDALPRSWTQMAVSETGIYMREYPYNDIWYLDFLSGVLEKIIEQ